MSHFSVLVILDKGVVPENKTAALAAVKPLMERYDENREVDPYPRSCDCAGWRADNRARTVADARHGTIQQLKDAFWLKEGGIAPDDEDNAGQQQRWNAARGPWEATKAAALEADPGKNAADPDCEDCHGTGTYMSTYNPDSKHDYYGVADSDGYSARMHDKQIFPLVELNPGWSVFAIVTPRGEWFARGKMGWWANVSDVDDNWAAQRYEIASAFPESYGVLLDARI